MHGKDKKGSEEGLREDIRRLDRDIMETRNKLEAVKRVEEQLTVDLKVMNTGRETAVQRLEELRRKIADLQCPLNSQKEIHGMSITQARSLTANFDELKLSNRVFYMKLEQLGEVHWLSVLENMSAFAEQHNRYRKLLEEVKKRCTPDHIKNALSLRQSVKDCLNLLEDILTKFSQCRWDVEVGIKRLGLEAKKMKEIDGVISRKLRDVQRAEQRAERERNRELDNLVNDIITTEAEIDRLENDIEVLETQSHRIGSF